MVRTGAFELHLLVNGVKQAELVGSNRIAYVESRFDSLATYNVTKREKDPYGEEYDQAWPVTPYTLKITNHSGDMASLPVFWATKAVPQITATKSSSASARRRVIKREDACRHR